MAALDAARAASLAGLPLGLFVRSLRAMLLAGPAAGRRDQLRSGQ
jgi:hypothetical protein